MKHGWNREIKIEKLDSSRKVVIANTTPREVVMEPNRYRQEDIINSLCIVVKELIKESEENATRLESILNMGESYEGIKEESEEGRSEEGRIEEKGKRDYNSENIIYNPQQA